MRDLEPKTNLLFLCLAVRLNPSRLLLARRPPMRAPESPRGLHVQIGKAVVQCVPAPRADLWRPLFARFPVLAATQHALTELQSVATASDPSATARRPSPRCPRTCAPSRNHFAWPGYPHDRRAARSLWAREPAPRRSTASHSFRLHTLPQATHAWVEKTKPSQSPALTTARLSEVSSSFDVPHDFVLVHSRRTVRLSFARNSDGP